MTLEKKLEKHELMFKTALSFIALVGVLFTITNATITVRNQASASVPRSEFLKHSEKADMRISALEKSVDVIIKQQQSQTQSLSRIEGTVSIIKDMVLKKYQ